jgi:hypothetical protein
LPDEPKFRFQPEAERAAIRRALDLLASFLGPGGDEQALAEFERLLNEDRALGLNALYGLAAIAAALVRTEADRSGEDPLDILHGIERALEEDGSPPTAT